jgi:hypothetical protein
MLRTSPLVVLAKSLALVAALFALTARVDAQAGTVVPPPAPPPPAATPTTAPVQPPTAPAEAQLAMPPAPPPPIAAAPGAPPASLAPTSAALAPAAEGSAPAAAVSDKGPAPAKTLSDWYGWQLLLVDLAGLSIGAAVAASVEDDATALGMLAGTWYGVSVIGAPAVHEIHGHWTLGVADFAMRSLAPPVAGLFGLLTSCLVEEEFAEDCSQTGLGIGMLLGIGLSSAFDAFILARTAQSEAPRNTGEWYGLQILLVDALGYLVAAYYAARGPEVNDDPLNPVISVWVMHYLLTTIAAPIVHFVHGRIGFGFASLGARMLIGPMGSLVGVIGFCAATGTDDCAETGATWGLLGGGLTIALLDAFVFAYEPEEVQTQSSIGVTVGPGSIGLAGRF